MKRPQQDEKWKDIYLWIPIALVLCCVLPGLLVTPIAQEIAYLTSNTPGVRSSIYIYTSPINWHALSFIVVPCVILTFNFVGIFCLLKLLQRERPVDRLNYRPKTAITILLSSDGLVKSLAVIILSVELTYQITYFEADEIAQKEGGTAYSLQMAQMATPIVQLLLLCVLSAAADFVVAMMQWKKDHPDAEAAYRELHTPDDVEDVFL